MQELDEFLYGLTQALKNEDFEVLKNYTHFVEIDDQDDYENRDLREILDIVQSYIVSKDISDRDKALELLDEFDGDGVNG